MDTIYKVNDTFYDAFGYPVKSKIKVKGDRHYKMVRFVDPIDLNAQVQYLPQEIQVEVISVEELLEIRRKESEVPSIRFAY
jgi:hypothetical protein